MIAGNIAGKTRTLPLAIYSEVAAGDMDTAGKYVLIKKDLEESLQEAGAAREELAAVRQAQVEAYMKRKPFPKRQGTVELKDAILRL